jgi:hypothetical protein
VVAEPPAHVEQHGASRPTRSPEAVAVGPDRRLDARRLRERGGGEERRPVERVRRRERGVHAGQRPGREHAVRGGQLGVVDVRRRGDVEEVVDDERFVQGQVPRSKRERLRSSLRSRAESFGSTRRSAIRPRSGRGSDVHAVEAERLDDLASDGFVHRQPVTRRITSPTSHPYVSAW